MDFPLQNFYARTTSYFIGNISFPQSGKTESNIKSASCPYRLLRQFSAKDERMVIQYLVITPIYIYLEIVMPAQVRVVIYSSLVLLHHVK